MSTNDSHITRLAELVNELSVVRGKVTLASGLESDEEISSDFMAPRRNAGTLTAVAAADVVIALGAADTLGVKPLEFESANDNDYAPNMQTAISEGCTLVVAVGFKLAAATIESANANPDLDFAIIDDYAERTGVRFWLKIALFVAVRAAGRAKRGLRRELATRLLAGGGHDVGATTTVGTIGLDALDVLRRGGVGVQGDPPVHHVQGRLLSRAAGGAAARPVVVPARSGVLGGGHGASWRRAVR